MQRAKPGFFGDFAEVSDFALVRCVTRLGRTALLVTTSGRAPQRASEARREWEREAVGEACGKGEGKPIAGGRGGEEIGFVLYCFIVGFLR